MEDVLKKALNLGLGTLLLTKEKVEDVVGELVKKGEVGHEEAEKLVSDLIEKGEKGKEEIEAKLEKIVKTVTAKLDFPTRKEFSELKSEIERLKENLEKKD